MVSGSFYALSADISPMTPFEVEGAPVRDDVAIAEPVQRNTAMATKRRRYLLKFRAAFAENGRCRGVNDSFTIAHSSNFITVLFGATVLCQFPYTHGHLKRAYFIFRLCGCNMSIFQQYIQENGTEMLLEDQNLSPHDSIGISEPRHEDFLPLMRTA